MIWLPALAIGAVTVVAIAAVMVVMRIASAVATENREAMASLTAFAVEALRSGRVMPAEHSTEPIRSAWEIEQEHKRELSEEAAVREVSGG